MEYVYYLMIVLALVFLCLFMTRQTGSVFTAARPADTARKSAALKPGNGKSGHKTSEPQRQAVLLRETKNVPIPWGWPGNHQRGSIGVAQGRDAGGVSDSWQRWVGQLMSEKRTVQDEAYLARQNDCVRALLEDRFGKVRTSRDLHYAKVRAGLLRDPAQRQDQMDSFPSGRLPEIESKLNRAPAVSNVDERNRAPVRFEGPKEIRTPWGW